MDAVAQKIIETMSPLEMGKMIYPKGVAVPYKKVLELVISNYLSKYTKQELNKGAIFQDWSKIYILYGEKGISKEATKYTLDH